MKFILKSTLVAAILLLFQSPGQSQNITIPDTLEGWDHSWVASLNGSQASYSNWSQGGVSSVSGTGSSVYKAMYQNNLFSYGFRTNLKYGQANIKGQGVRKTDDVISVSNRFKYSFNEDSNWSGYGEVQFRTQFDRGYDYASGPEESDVLISNFLSPAYLTEGVGIAYEPTDNFIFQAGMGLKQTIVSDDSLSTNYGLDPGENFKSEGGITTGIGFEKEIFKNILYSSSMETFTNLLIPISETDIMWSNELTGKINDIVSASFQFEMRYDNDYSSELQIKQVLSAGVSVSLY